jgi:hypothetical protein
MRRHGCPLPSSAAGLEGSVPGCRCWKPAWTCMSTSSPAASARSAQVSPSARTRHAFCTAWAWDMSWHGRASARPLGGDDAANGVNEEGHDGGNRR